MAEKIDKIKDFWPVGGPIRFTEEKGEVKGYPVLGRIVGPHFVPDGKSRNGRYYEKKAWEQTLLREDATRQLDRGLMFGTIGHAED